MDLNKENLKKIRGLIVFTVILLIALWNYQLILGAVSRCLGIVFPFLLGGAIAFGVNVPMSFFEEKLFQNQVMKKKKLAQKLARPASLVITLIAVLSVISLVIFGVLPKLGDTFLALGKSIQDFMPKVQVWAEEIFWIFYVCNDRCFAFDRVGVWKRCGKCGTSKAVFTTTGKKYVEIIAYRCDIHLDRSE